jgi:hypothetical protein
MASHVHSIFPMPFTAARVTPHSRAEQRLSLGASLSDEVGPYRPARKWIYS